MSYGDGAFNKEDLDNAYLKASDIPFWKNPLAEDLKKKKIKKLNEKTFLDVF